MTVGHIGHSWDLDPRLLDEVAGTPTPHRSGHPLTLAETARSRGVPVGKVIAQVEAALEALKSHPQGHPGPRADDGSDASGRAAGP